MTVGPNRSPELIYKQTTAKLTLVCDTVSMRW